MNYTLKILICENNVQIEESFKNYFKDYDASLRFCKKNGNVLLEQIADFAPDVVITELFLSGIDAIGVLEKSMHLEHHPKLFFATSAVDNENVIRRALKSGFNFFFIKPYSVENVISKIELMMQCGEKVSVSTESIITHVLREMEMPPHLKGFACIRDGVAILLNEPEAITSVTKVLYPKIAQINNTTATRVERAMRNAIEITWNRGNEILLKELFPYHWKNYIKPSNSEFIANIADYIRSVAQRKRSS